MNHNFSIRPETPADYREAEALTREAYNGPLVKTTL